MIRLYYFLVWCVLRAYAAFRPRDVIMLDGAPYMRRFYLRGKPGGSGPSVRLQHILMSDRDRELHDHPWEWARTTILRGGYTEQRRACYWPGDTDVEWGVTRTKDYCPGDRMRLLSGRCYADYHRIAKVRPGGAWTLFRTSERHGRGWGFK